MTHNNSILAVILSLASFSFTTPSHARDHQFYAPPPPTPSRSEQFGVNLGAGVLGLAAGVVIGQALTPQREVIFERHDRPDGHFDRDRWQRHNYYQQNIYYNREQSMQPWSANWYRWCSNTYDTFNPRTGTYEDFFGDKHFCSYPN